MKTLKQTKVCRLPTLRKIMRLNHSLMKRLLEYFSEVCAQPSDLSINFIWKEILCFHCQQDLATVLETELRGAAKTVVDALLYIPEMYNVTSLKEAFESKDYDTVVSIIISSRNDSLMDMKEKYFAGEYNCFFFFFFNWIRRSLTMFGSDHFYMIWPHVHQVLEQWLHFPSLL